MTRLCMFDGCDQPARLYASGLRCVAHGPPPQPDPDPDLTLTGLRRRAGLPATTATTVQLADDRAVVSGKRRSSPQTYAAAASREDARRIADGARRQGTATRGR